ncbi:MAG: hypothetical protein R6X18_12480 [Chloroflexota bacterium]
MPDKLIETNTSVFLAIGNQRIQRAACVPGEDWWVETVLNEPVKPVTLAADPANAAHVFAGTNGKGIYHSTDKGETWSHLGLDGQIVKSIAVSPHNSKVIYAGVKPAAMFKSVDGGHTWAELDGFRRIPNRWWWFSPAEKPFQPYVMAIAVSPTEPDVVLAGIEFGAVVRSEDGGRSWSGHRQGAIRDCHSLKFHRALPRRYSAPGIRWAVSITCPRLPACRESTSRSWPRWRSRPARRRSRCRCMDHCS